MMNVLFICHERTMNGASRSLFNLIEELGDRCNFFVISPYLDGPVVEALQKHQIPHYYVPFKRWIQVKNHKFVIKKIAWKLVWNRRNSSFAETFALKIKDLGIDIIHSNSIVTDFGYRLSKITGIPHIWHARELGKEDFNMYPLVSEENFSKVVADGNHLVCISKAVRAKYSERIDKDKIHLIYNGVGPENRNPRKQYNLSGCFKCLQAASFQAAKGQLISIKAMCELHRRGYSDIELMLAGRGELKKIGVKKNMLEGVTVLGQVENLCDIRAGVDVEIVASRAEAFGRVTVEAMMSGNPVIGSSSGGTPELIEDGVTGLLFEPGNHLDLADKIEFLFLNRKKVKEMGAKAFEYSKDYFCIERCANEVFSLYTSVVKT